MSRESFYFSHDYNSRADNKVKRLLLKHGMEGYGVFWAIVEDLYNNANALPLDYDCIAYDLRTQCDIVKSVINDFELFIFDGNFFGSTSVERRLKERNKKSETARQSAIKRWGKCKRNAKAMQTQCEGNAIKERKGKDIKENKINIIPTLMDVKNYCKERNNDVDAVRWYNFYESKGWMIGKNKMKDWKAAVRTWEAGQKEESFSQRKAREIEELKKQLENG
jgi:hypothetical protein